MANAQTKSIEELFQRDYNYNYNYNFIVKSYQRGYRWEESQVKHLIEDISSFDRSGEYCLQPIIVKKINNENCYEVVDGQQRLTTLWLLKALYDSFSGIGNCNSWNNYSIRYEGKPFLTELINDVLKPYFSSQHNLEQIKDFIEERRVPGNTHPDIDFMLTNLVTILGHSKQLSPGRSKTIASFLSDIFAISDKASRSDKIKIIWYELDEDEDPISVFTNVNANKIKLTESELVKAKMLSIYKDDISKRNKLALEWESIERGLCDDNLWRFIAGKADKETRINLLFDIWRNNLENNSENAHSDYPIFDCVDNMINNGGENVDAVWTEICRIYYSICDWHADKDIYHLLGLLIAISKSSEVDKIIKKLYTNNWETTDAFIELIKGKIAAEAKSILGFQDNEDFDINSIEESIRSLKYGSDDTKIRKVLLMFNIALLYHSRNSHERFPFDLFFDDNYDIEHINPQSRNSGEADTKSIGNLVLLDANTNRCDAYKTGNYSVKRSIIIDIIRNGSRTGDNADMIKTKYVPIGTRWVFLGMLDTQNNDSNEWKGHDKYIKDIALNITNLFSNAVNQTEVETNA